MRIVFLGSGEFGLPTLSALCEHHDVPLVISQPDRPAGRKRKLTPTPIAAWSQARSIETIKPDNVNDEAILSRLRSGSFDAAIVVAFGQYIKQALTTIPTCGAMNLHGSRLPKYRGAAPINWAVIRGETITGNTVIRLAKRMDAGAMLGQDELTIDPQATAGEVHDALAAQGPTLILDVLRRAEAGELAEVEQDESQATQAPKLSRADAVLDFTAAADAVRCRLHGLTPWPGVTVHVSQPSESDPHPLRLSRCHALPDHKHDAMPGTMIGDGVIATGSGAIQLLEVQPPGKRVMNWTEYQRGHALPTGTTFASIPQAQGPRP